MFRATLAGWPQLNIQQFFDSALAATTSSPSPPPFVWVLGKWSGSSVTQLATLDRKGELAVVLQSVPVVSPSSVRIIGTQDQVALFDSDGVTSIRCSGPQGKGCIILPKKKAPIGQVNDLCLGPSNSTRYRSTSVIGI